MSWEEDIKSEFTITTGDGKIYIAEGWLSASKDTNFNFTEFNFPNVKGSLVDRRLVKGAKYDLRIFFQGNDNLDKAEAFRISAEDSRYWIINHPYYKIINVQPTSLSYDNQKHNVTEITGTLIETITDTNPKLVVIPEDKVSEDVSLANESTALGYENGEQASSTTINTMKQSNNVYYNRNVSSIIEELDAEEYFNLFNEAQSRINFAASEAGLAIRAAQNFLIRPATFFQSVKSRLKMLSSNFNDLRTTLEGTLKVNDKQTYEAYGNTLINGVCLASVTLNSDDDYNTRVEVQDTIELLLSTYNNYLTDLDSIQVGTGGNPGDYIPDAESLTRLNALVNYTMGNLYNISFQAKQERIIILEDDSDYITVSHRVYGSDFEDNNIDELIRNNNFGLNTVLNIPKGTEIKYYI
ncbi:MAG: hypothetical protein ACPGSO_00665 [Vicingaceae bacterium]